MTSGSTQRSHNTMSSNARTIRLTEYVASNNMSDSSDNVQPARGSALTTTPWQGQGIWANGVNSFTKGRETTGFADRSDAFSGAPSGSSALAATSEANPWNARSGPWNPSDNTSPRSRSDGSAHDMNGISPYYTAASAVSQRGPVGSKPQTTLDPSSSAFKFSTSFAGFADETESRNALNQLKHEAEQRLGKFSAAQRHAQAQAQEPSFLNSLGNGHSRDPSILPSTQTGSDIFADYSYGVPATTASIHSQRPSLTGSSVSFPTSSSRGYGQTPLQPDDAELAERVGRIAMGSDSNGAGGPLVNLSNPYNAAQGFQFNPVSQPWENGQSYQNNTARDMYANGPGFEKRGSVVDRSSPTGSSYRAGGGLNSPRSFTGTPQPVPDSWSRPGSRDPRLGADMDRRNVGQPFLPQAQGPFFPGPYYNPGFQQVPHVYDPYLNARQQLPVPGFGVPMGPFPVGTGPLPFRPPSDRDPTKRVRSLALEEFRSSPKSNRRYELKDIYNHLVEFSGDQHGSRFIQQKLETASSDEKDHVFREIEPNAVQLMKDVFGNYVIQKFFEHGNQAQKKVLAAAMKGKVVDLSTQMYACRVVQKALQHVLIEQQAELVKEMESDILQVIKQQNGNHVVQQIIALVPRQHIDFIFSCFKDRVCELASHQYGCRVIQRALEYGTEADKAAMMKELHGCAQMLITDQFGNYVAQHVIEKGKPEDSSKMISLVMSQLLSLSKHKFASNVVEACIKHGTLEDRRAIRDRLINSGDDANSPLFQLMKDQYGNYVIQKLLTTLEGQDRVVLVDKLKPHFAPLKKAGATGRQIAAIDRLISAASTTPNGTSESTAASTAPTSPGLCVDVNSASQTPNLTVDSSSPLSTPSTSPPCTVAAGDEVTPHGDNEAGKNPLDPATEEP
ncbi:hypothetical protein VTK26DRAFT_4564 [Humicola hyalothermophila]